MVGMVSGARVPQYQQLADTLRSQIMSGDLAAGERLPPEPELMARYGVSRSTWREALRTLAAEKLVIATRGVTGGTFVVEPSTDDIEAYLRNSLVMLARSQLSAEQILEARRFLEIPACGIAAERRSDEHIAALRQSIVDLDATVDDATWSPNNEFHNTLLDATANPLLRALLSPISAALHRNIERDHAGAGFRDQVSREHREILEAVEARDATGAEEAMRRHLDSLHPVYVKLGRRGKKQTPR
ncbi:FadR/GntR family transcriptional regulator [Amycolatopsis thermophila]|uniref:DNA-binding FadR family transcriptional regulator n=1 Tax=Amycolatopsis thermophila TaxID=206084 RepID=A0ABU0F551_9PSEU|nr:FadR/GntR family transcriptional regulator [Amycolatopsis thermophila]MDQ0382493.1 DNA-binding FadR family transcriptional regulator [Amycolatopsis thermophila]